MATETSARLELVTKTTDEWAQVQDVIAKGVPCVELADGGKTYIKVGNGTASFAELPYISDPKGGQSVAVDSELSDSSENPVQNKVINAELEKCLKSTDTITLKCTL